MNERWGISPDSGYKETFDRVSSRILRPSDVVNLPLPLLANNQFFPGDPYFTMVMGRQGSNRLALYQDGNPLEVNDPKKRTVSPLMPVNVSGAGVAALNEFVTRKIAGQHILGKLNEHGTFYVYHPPSQQVHAAEVSYDQETERYVARLPYIEALIEIWNLPDPHNVQRRNHTGSTLYAVEEFTAAAEQIVQLQINRERESRGRSGHLEHFGITIESEIVKYRKMLAQLQGDLLQHFDTVNNSLYRLSARISRSDVDMMNFSFDINQNYRAVKAKLYQLLYAHNPVIENKQDVRRLIIDRILDDDLTAQEAKRVLAGLISSYDKKFVRKEDKEWENLYYLLDELNILGYEMRVQMSLDQREMARMLFRLKRMKG